MEDIPIKRITNSTVNTELVPSVSSLLQLLLTNQQAISTVTTQNHHPTPNISLSSSSATAGIINTLFKSGFPTFPISVGDFVLQKITKDIIGNWGNYGFALFDIYIYHFNNKIFVVETESITISPTQVPKLISDAVLPTDEIEANDADVQLSIHKTLSDEQEDTRN
ncbi:unnamed protein product [Rhizophagus irregularis]|uniref:Uncharacterized protein n=1 Tax=Rhizophagus irregularis TaxID=588596 RepID=A0A916EJX2_9GLOM|nr:unnamed protein product [Rhizophagus irregularis]